MTNIRYGYLVRLITGLVAALVAFPAAALAQGIDPAAAAKIVSGRNNEGKTAAKKKAYEEDEETDAPASVVHAKVKAEAAEQYRKLTAAYMDGKWDQVKEILGGSSKWIYGLTPQQKADLTYVRGNYQEYRPAWWKSCRSENNVSFPATIWKRQFTANYMPTEMLGAQAALGIRNNKIQVIVTWRPTYLDSTTALEGDLAKRHGLTEGHLAEVIVWHELGHNYVTNFLPLEHVLRLYIDYMPLFTNLQEFYADMTSLHHCSPKGRLANLMLRLETIDPSPPTGTVGSRRITGAEPTASQRRQQNSEPHARAALGIGSYLLTQFLAEPEKWPSIHFPPKVPDSDIEKKTVIYVYENIAPNWTITEDRTFREMIYRFIATNGEPALRKKGLVALPNRQSYHLMYSEDGDYRTKREAWISEQLKKVIDSGRADKQPPSARRPGELGRIVIPD